MTEITEQGYHPTIATEQLSDGQTMAFSIGEHELLLCRSKGKFYAFKNECTHQAKPLTNAKIRRGTVICPFHGAQFNLSDGESLSALAHCALTTYSVEVQNNRVMVRL